MKVLYISAGASGYGGENALFTLVTNIPEGIEPVVVVPEEGPLTEKLKQAHIRVIKFPYAVLQRRYFHPFRIISYKLFLAVSIPRFISLFIKIRPDVVHTNTSQVFPAAFAAKILGIPHIWHIREMPGIPPALWNIWKWLILRLSTKVVCISSAVKGKFNGNPKTTVVHDGIDVALFPFTPAKPAVAPDLFSAVRQQDEMKRVGMVGRINYWKGQNLFVEAANIVLKERKDVIFFIAGDARKEYRRIEEELHRRIENYGISGAIVFTGFLPGKKTAGLLESFDVFVLPSVQPEPFGLVLVEAMASGKAVVAPAEGGPLDIVTDGISGLLVEPRNPQAYAKAILYLLDNDEVRMKLGNSARKRVEERFTKERTVSEVVKLYKECPRP